ncbi:hypothetical protein LAUMK191_02984 [Mycobacterium attenuatum]|nr:hypothetical protein LAUMK191_02984 [Mycobacterium attenuatum]
MDQQVNTHISQTIRMYRIQFHKFMVASTRPLSREDLRAGLPLHC